MNKKPKIRKPKKHGGGGSGIWKLIIFIVIIAALVGITMFYMSVMNYKPRVRHDDEIPFETIGNEEEEYVNAIDNNGNLDPTKPIKTSSGQYKRSDDDFYTFLLLGKDSVGMNTDVIMLVSYNITDDEIAVMQIPRDTYIEINGSAQKINSMYAILYNAAKRNGDSDPMKSAMKSFVDILQKSLNVKIDFNAFVNLDGFKNIIDAIGGVEIDVPYDMHYSDPEQNLYIDLKKGHAVLDGDKSEQFIRFRSDYIEGDIGRVNAQKLFMTALLKQIESSLTLTKIPKIASEAIKNTTTEISLNDTVYFAKAALSADVSNAVMFTLPGMEARANVNSGTWYYIMRRADTLNLINRYFNVYTREITDSIFDINRVFNADDRPHISKIYNTAATDDINDLIHTLSDIDENGVYIPLYK
jgi:cell envelope-related function transcriptional attenuator common domain